MPVFQWDSSYSSENSRRYQKMKFRRDRRKGGDNIPIIDDGVKFSPSAEHKVFALCNLIRSNAAYLQRMGQKQFYEKERWVESELPELCEFFSKAQWVIREESLAMGARWAKIRLADIDKLEFFRIVRLRINQAIQGDILQEGTQSWKDWRQAEEDPSKCRSTTWAGDYTKKAIRWLATQILKIDAGENDEDEDETQCELYKYYFIRMKRKLTTVSLVKQLKEELGRPNLEIIMLGDQEEEESEEKKRARTLEAISRWEEERAVEDEEKQQQQRRQKKKNQKPNSSIMRTLASERVKREEEIEAVKVKQQQDHEAALQRALQEEEEQKRQTEARKMERRRKKKEEKRLRKGDPKKWEQKNKWLQKEKTGKLGYCQFCGEKATIVCRECYDVGLCMASDGCAKTHRQKCSTYYVHEGNEVD